MQKDDAFFQKSIINASRDCDRRNTPFFTQFLSEEEADSVSGLPFCPGVFAVLYGGERNGDAVRQMLGLFPSMYSDFEETELYAMFPIRAVTIKWRKEDKITHRDVLGSIMALGLERKTIGDIYVSEGNAVVYATETALMEITREINKIGKTGVRCTEGIFVDELKRDFDELSFSVASLRLDCIVPCIAKCSRTSGVEKYIRTQLVTVNSAVCTESSRLVNVGDRIAVRGYGKFLLYEDKGKGRKGNIHIVIRKYK